MHVCAHVSMYVCVRVNIYACVCAYIYVCLYVYVCVPVQVGGQAVGVSLSFHQSFSESKAGG